MSRYAANLTYLFTELPMPQRFAAARRAGFEGIEILFPYDLTVKELSTCARDAGLEFILMSTPPPNWAGGPRGFAAEPGNEARFRKDFDRALMFAQGLHARHIHVMAGKAQGPRAHQTLVENLRWATARAPHASLTIEPVCAADDPEAFLTCFDQAAGIIAEVAAPNLGLQFDTYQAHRIHGDIMAVWERHGHLVRHIQIAGSHDDEPFHDSICTAEFIRAVEASGYRGWVGAEYKPSTAITSEGLNWMHQRPALGH